LAIAGARAVTHDASTPATTGVVGARNTDSLNAACNGTTAASSSGVCEATPHVEIDDLRLRARRGDELSNALRLPADHERILAVDDRDP
jgi:hypothetical protein